MGALVSIWLFEVVLSLPAALYSVNCAIYAIQGVGPRRYVALYARWLGWGVLC